MSIVISSDVFEQRRLEREFDSLMAQYIGNPNPELSNISIQYICDNYKVKAIMNAQLMGEGTITSYALTSSSEILQQTSDLEFDYEFITKNLLRLDVSPIVWIDVYFSNNLSEEEENYICELLEDDVMINSRLVDDSLGELTSIFKRMTEIAEYYESKFGISIHEVKDARFY